MASAESLPVIRNPKNLAVSSSLRAFLSIHKVYGVPSLYRTFIDFKFHSIMVRGDLLSLWSHVLLSSRTQNKSNLTQPLHFTSLRPNRMGCLTRLIDSKSLRYVSPRMSIRTHFFALWMAQSRSLWLSLRQQTNDKFNRLSIYAGRCAHTFARLAIVDLCSSRIHSKYGFERALELRGGLMSRTGNWVTVERDKGISRRCWPNENWHTSEVRADVVDDFSTNSSLLPLNVVN